MLLFGVPVADALIGQAPANDAVIAAYRKGRRNGLTAERRDGRDLIMVYGFIKQSGGHAKIYSEPDHGTTVRLHLPPADAEVAAAAAPPPEEMPRGHETIMIVEDDPLVREFVVGLLSGLGYRTIVASDGAEALARLEAAGPIDLLFCDVVLPGGVNGRQLAEIIRGRRPGLKVLYTSGYTENAIVHHGRLDPGVLLLAKPYRMADLARTIRRALDGEGAG